MNTRDILIAARAMVATPEKWCQHEYETKTGAHCSFGAVRTTAEWNEDTASAIHKLAVAMGMPTLFPIGLAYCWVINFNDSHTHADVLAAFDRAIGTDISAFTALLNPAKELEDA